MGRALKEGMQGLPGAKEEERPHTAHCTTSATSSRESEVCSPATPSPQSTPVQWKTFARKCTADYPSQLAANAYSHR